MMSVEEVYLRPEDYELETLAQHIGDTRFWLDLLRHERPARVLEVGCGCGRLTLPLARLGACQGITVTGLEMEPAMLRQAEEHARAQTEQTRAALRLALGDARDLDSALRRGNDGATSADLFDVILMPYGVAHHLTTSDDQLRAWRGARRWLRPGGLLAVDVTAPDLSRMAAGLDAQTERHVDLKVSHAGRALQRTCATRYHPETQAETLAFDYQVREAGGARHGFRSTFTMAVYFPRELQTLFAATGFNVERLLGSYDGEPYTAHSPLLLALGRAV